MLPRERPGQGKNGDLSPVESEEVKVAAYAMDGYTHPGLVERETSTASPAILLRKGWSILDWKQTGSVSSDQSTLLL